VSSKRPLVWIAVLCLAPFVASFAFYFWLRPNAQVNYGTLLPAQQLPAVSLRGAAGDAIPGDPLRGKWTLLTIDAPACPEACAKKLYATRQARTMQGKERERVARLWLVAGDGAPPAEVQIAHPDLTIAKADPALVAALRAALSAASSSPGLTDAIFLVDPLGNLILRYPGDPDIRRLYKDVARLLYASRIG